MPFRIRRRHHIIPNGTQSPRAKCARQAGAQAGRVCARAHKSSRTLLDGTRLIGRVRRAVRGENNNVAGKRQGARNPEVAQTHQAVEPVALICSDELFDEITQVETPEGVDPHRRNSAARNEIAGRFSRGAEGVQDPATWGITAHCAAAGATSAYSPRDARMPGRRIAARWHGAQFVLPVRERVDLTTALSGFKASVIGTSPRAKKSIFDVI